MKCMLSSNSFLTFMPPISASAEMNTSESAIASIGFSATQSLSNPACESSISIGAFEVFLASRIASGISYAAPMVLLSESMTWNLLSFWNSKKSFWEDMFICLRVDFLLKRGLLLPVLQGLNPRVLRFVTFWLKRGF